MSKLIWNESGHRRYELGVDRGVFYPLGSPGVPWNGLTSVTEAPSGADVSTNFVDGHKFVSRIKTGEFAATIEAFTYPEEFEEYDGFSLFGSQGRKPFNFAYRTFLGNDLQNEKFGYLIHLVYNALVSPSERNYGTLAAEVEPTKFSWELSTVPELFPSGDMGSHLVIDTRYAYLWAVSAVEDFIYGTDDTDPRMPSAEEIFEIFQEAAVLKITNHGDGTWTAEGPDDVVSMLDPTTFQIDWPSVTYLDSETYTVHSL